MTDNLYKIDLSNIDNEILEIENQIITLNAKKALKVELKEYIKKNAIPLNGHTNELASSVKIINSGYGGISDFITFYLDISPGVDTKTIITSYAKETKKTYEEVSNNISNALSRLKTAKKIRSEEKPGGRKAGFNWFLNN